jgi:hypothetical protein
MSFIKLIAAAIIVAAASNVSAISIGEYRDMPEHQSAYMKCTNIKFSPEEVQFSTEEGVVTIAGLVHPADLLLATVITLPVVEEDGKAFVARGTFYGRKTRLSLLGTHEVEALLDYAKRQAIIVLAGSRRTYSSCTS